MMHFKKHKRGFVMAEIVISLAVIGILLTAIVQLQLNVSYQVMLNVNTCEYLMLAKKELYAYLRQDPEKRTIQLSGSVDDAKAEIREEKLSVFEPLQALKVVVARKKWASMMHERSVALTYAYPHKKKEEKKEKKNDK